LRLKAPVPLQEHAEVRVTIEANESATTAGDPAEDFVGFVKNAPEGVPLAAEHDHFLYGAPRR
jgi:hypothetical protein